MKRLNIKFSQGFEDQIFHCQNDDLFFYIFLLVGKLVCDLLNLIEEILNIYDEIPIIIYLGGYVSKREYHKY